MTATRKIVAPMPDLLGRQDKDNGRWQIQPVPMEPGKARTFVVDHRMDVPVGDNQQERMVRAHEMMHAKCSPANEWPTWIERGFASRRALEVAEEFRVNTLCARSGFDVKNHLTDGSEKQTGEQIAQRGLWDEGVYMTAAFAGTARLKPFISGVRKHNPEWADAFRALATRLAALVRRVSTDRLGATGLSRHGLAPAGFAYTEEWAILLDQIANPPQDDEDEDDEAQGNDDADGQAQDGEPQDGKPGRKPGKKPGKKPKMGADAIKKIKPMGKNGGKWDTLRVERCPMPRLAPGGMGRKKRPADRGRHPRRIHRMLVDPQRRVFDATKRGNGGVVLIDGSGSMRFTQQDIMRLVEAAPGATVAVYSSNGDVNRPNVFVLADKGRMVDVLPDRVPGNGVDRPALEWAVSQRQHPKAPVVWITDGAVHGPGQGYTDQMGLDCYQKVIQHRVIVAKDVAKGVDVLRALGKGQKPQRWIPRYWKQSWQSVMGTNPPV